MEILYVLGSIAKVIVFFAIGYGLWSYGRSSYGFNIYGLGTAVRGLLSYLTLFLAIVASSPDYRLIFLVLTGILWLWTFVLTASKTNLLLALFALPYQAVAAIIFYFLLNRAAKVFYSVKDRF
ncbi:hypothetical protein [Arthrospiribacter ruber]|uniref:Uncharacterized protein n=1 Tax=Arthrospiribacter ruber TaxID=2487934 RepID=A0A951MCE6_9BACT|nr:hypothetical protein [Arthrospiribacter ruber]MBW3469256.1 hypothetical protein [Arthrospiribacter ruber]